MRNCLPVCEWVWKLRRLPNFPRMDSIGKLAKSSRPEKLIIRPPMQDDQSWIRRWVIVPYEKNSKHEHQTNQQQNDAQGARCHHGSDAIFTLCRARGRTG